MIATFGLLGMAILSVWLPAVPLGQAIRIPVWSVLLMAAIAGAMALGFLGALALLPIGVLAALCSVAVRLERQPDRMPWLRRLVLLAVGLLSLALAMHLAPGFRNPRVINEMVLSPGAPPFSQYLNFDKGAVGLLLLAFLCRRANNWAELGTGLRSAALPGLRTIAMVMACGVLIGYVAVDLKLPAVTPIFMLANLLFTCVAEEAFFRGLLQERLASWHQHRRGGAAIAIVAVGLLFGAAHLAGGWKAGLLASMAGIGYGVAYHRSQKIEAAILLHFALNAVQFLAFSYPYLR